MLVPRLALLWAEAISGIAIFRPDEPFTIARCPWFSVVAWDRFVIIGNSPNPNLATELRRRSSEALARASTDLIRVNATREHMQAGLFWSRVRKDLKSSARWGGAITVDTAKLGGIVRSVGFVRLELFAAITAISACILIRWMFRIARRELRRRARRCMGCGYDLTGNTSGVCPECGKPTALS